MATADTQYSPFQQELLNNLGQINTNVTCLIDVFMKFQDSLLSRKRLDGLTLPQSISSVTPISKEPRTPPKSNGDTLGTGMRSLLQTSKSMPHDIKPLHVHTIKEGANESEVTPSELKDDDTGQVLSKLDDSFLISRSEGGLHEDPIRSLDSADDDDRNSVSLPLDHDPLSRSQVIHAKSCRSSAQYDSKQFICKMKGKGDVSSSTRNRTRNGHRNKSNSARVSSASMAQLLRTNQHRGHGNGYRGKQRSSMFNASKPPVFNPDHVLLGSNNRVSINVGGNRFQTTLNTLAADQSSMLSAMFSGRFKLEQDDNGSIFIDRDPTHFRHILNFLRDGIEYLKHGGLLQQPEAIVNELLQEAKYYNIRPLVDYIQLQQTRKNKKRGDELTHEKQYKLIGHVRLEDLENVFNKYTGSAGYDFEEWLYVSPWKTSRNNTTTPFVVMLFSKKLSRAEVRLLDRLTNADFQ